MIISKKFNFIFLKTFRSNTENFEYKIYPYLGQGDYLSFKMRDFEKKIRDNKVSYYSDHFLKKKDKKKLLFLRSTGNLYSNIISIFKLNFDLIDTINFQDEFDSHESIINIKRKLKNDIFDSYFKFCFYRPYSEVIISHYKYLTKHQHQNQNSFNKYFFINYKKFFFKYNNIFSYKNMILVDRIYNFKNLQKAYEDILKKIKLKKQINYFTKTRVNNSNNNNNNNICLSDEMKYKIKQLEKNSLINSNEFKKKLY